MKILCSKVIWATDFRFLNDPLEISYAIEKVIQIIGKYNCPEFGALIDLLNEKLRKDQYHMLKASFVKHDDYLPCWRYYGDDGKGLSISFNREKLKEGFIRRGHKSIISDVIYEEKKQEAFLCTLIEHYMKKKNHKDFSSIATILFLCLPIFKDIDWKDELELRCISPHIYMEKSNSYILSPLPISKVVQESTSLQYRLFEFEYDEIEKVTIGPCADFHYLKNRIIAELLKVGVDKIPFPILKSEKKYVP